MFELAASLMLGGDVNRMKFLVCPASYPADAKESSCRGWLLGLSMGSVGCENAEYV
jgi:hypothetical protein